ncbi:MAG: KTSC domain-containing protein [Rhodocyclaceae bacterium]|nr:KTSC domain-containing protein [Rhodocyclaceae bacterium]
MANKRQPAPFSDEPYTPIATNPVESNRIKAVGYNPETKTMAVIFKHGAGNIYHYPDVEQDEYDQFVKADSLGTHFSKQFQGRHFKKFRLPDQPAE